jgi:hypothetical protein
MAQQADSASTTFFDLFAPPHGTDTAVLPAIILKPATALPALPAEDIARAVEFARQDKAESTRRAYRSDFAAFTAWCTGGPRGDGRGSPRHDPAQQDRSGRPGRHDRGRSWRRLLSGPCPQGVARCGRNH